MRVLFLLQKNKNHLQKLRLMSNDSVTNHCTSHFQGSCWAWIHTSRLTKNLELLYQIQPSMAAGSQIPFGYLGILEMAWLSLSKGINLCLMNKADPKSQLLCLPAHLFNCSSQSLIFFFPTPPICPRTWAKEGEVKLHCLSCFQEECCKEVTRLA